MPAGTLVLASKAKKKMKKQPKLYKFKKTYKSTTSQQIKKLKQDMNRLKHNVKVKCVTQIFKNEATDNTSFWVPDKDLFFFPTQDVEEDPSYAYNTKMIEGRDSNKITLLRTKVHLTLDQLLPFKQYRILLINILDSPIDIDTISKATQQCGMFLKHGGFHKNNGSLINKDNGSLIINSQINYRDRHTFKVLYDKVFTTTNVPGNMALNTDNIYNYVTKYHTININHQKRDKRKIGLDQEFADATAVSDKNRLLCFVYVNQAPNAMVRGHSEQFFVDVE